MWHVMTKFIPYSKIQCSGPRYTSYPTVPYWQEQDFSLEMWKQTLKRAFDEQIRVKGLVGIYPFAICESFALLWLS